MFNVMGKLTASRVLFTLVFVIIVSAALASLPNYSNFPTNIFVAIITALLTKYILGDWDDGFVWSKSDIIYWLSIGTTGYVTATYMS